MIESNLDELNAKEELSDYDMSCLILRRKQYTNRSDPQGYYNKRII